MLTRNRIAIAAAAFAVLAASSSGALAQKKYDTGATDTEIKIGRASCRERVSTIV